MVGANAVGANAVGANAVGANAVSIAERDKMLMQLEQQIESKEAQLAQDYKRLLRDVKQNPYLQVAIEEYKTHFTQKKKEEKEKIKALSVLLNYTNNPSDSIDIKREITYIKRKNNI